MFFKCTVPPHGQHLGIGLTILFLSPLGKILLNCRGGGQFEPCIWLTPPIRPPHTKQLGITDRIRQPYITWGEIFTKLLLCVSNVLGLESPNCPKIRLD